MNIKWSYVWHWFGKWLAVSLTVIWQAMIVWIVAVEVATEPYFWKDTPLVFQMLIGTFILTHVFYATVNRWLRWTLPSDEEMSRLIERRRSRREQPT